MRRKIFFCSNAADALNTFNEAAAKCGGKSARMPRRLAGILAFNEAAAKCGGK